MSSGISGTGIGLSILSALGFSTLGIFAANLYKRGFSVPQTLAWRFAAASVFLWCLIGVREMAKGRSAASGPSGGKEAADRGKGGKFPGLVLLALLGFTPQAGLFFLTVKLLAPGITSLLLYLYPAFVLLLSSFFYGAKPSKGQKAALAMSFVGCATTFFEPGSYPLGGLLLGIFVALSYGAYLVFGEKILAGYDPLFSTAVIMTTAGIVYWAFVLSSGATVKTPSGPSEWALVACIALLATVLPITTLFAAMKLVGAANASLVSTVEPVSTVLLSTFFLGEAMTVNRILGGALILGGVIALRLLDGGGARRETPERGGRRVRRRSI